MVETGTTPPPDDRPSRGPADPHGAEPPLPGRSPAERERTDALGADPARAQPRRSRGKRLLWVLIAVIAAFLAGFGWQYYEARSIQTELEQTVQALSVERLRVGLAQAAVAAQSGDFEAARRQMSDFFTAMQGRLEELPPDVRTVGRELLVERDEVITALSRANPEAADMLYGMLQRFRTSVGDPPAQAAPTVEDEVEGTPEGVEPEG